MKWEGSEKRRFVRAKFPCELIIYFPQEHIVSTYTENIGAGGIRVIIEEKLEISTIVGLEVYMTEEPISCKGKVVWVVEKESNYCESFSYFDTGIEFSDIKEKDRVAIKNFVDAIVAEQG